MAAIYGHVVHVPYSEALSFYDIVCREGASLCMDDVADRHRMVELVHAWVNTLTVDDVADEEPFDIALTQEWELP